MALALCQGYSLGNPFRHPLRRIPAFRYRHSPHYPSLFARDISSNNSIHAKLLRGGEDGNLINGKQLLENQEALLREIHHLQLSIHNLQQKEHGHNRPQGNDDSIISRQIEIGHPPQTTGSSDAGISEGEGKTIEVELDRTSFRLDGLEVYAVVSALTLATSIQFFDLLSDRWQWGEYFAAALAAMSSTAPLANRVVLHLRYLFGISTDFVCLAACATGMFTGLHATLVFSLMTVYGRTAVGCGWDESFQRFFESTEQVRFRGFRSFRVSLYSFLVQILFIIVSRLPPRSKHAGAMVLIYAVWRIFKDTQFIINKAGAMMFAGRPHLNGGENIPMETQQNQQQDQSQMQPTPQQIQCFHHNDDYSGDILSP